MQKIGIETTQNVKIDYTLAGLGTRLGAFVLDGMILFAYAMVILLYFNNLIGGQSIALSTIFSLPFFTYHLVSEIFMNGQSIGKARFNIKVVKLDGTPPALSAYFLRWILKPVDLIFFGSIAMVSIILTKNGQRLGDLAAGTTVVKTQSDEVFTPLEIMKRLGNDYQPTFKQATQLKPQDIETILEALRIFREHGNREPVNKITAKIRTLLNIESQMPPVTFLWTIVKDYYYLSGEKQSF